MHLYPFLITNIIIIIIIIIKSSIEIVFDNDYYWVFFFTLALHGHLIQDVQSLLHSFDFFSFTHVRRQGNNVTHALAKMGY